MKVILKYEPPDYVIVLKAETVEEIDILQCFQRQRGDITAQIKSEKYYRFDHLEIRKEADR